MNNQAFVMGFVKRATDYGFNENEAVGILKESGAMEDYFKNRLPFDDWSTGTEYFRDGIIGGGIGALGGAGIGALFKSKDEKGETHRGRNALIGALTGAGVGGFGGNEYGKSVVGNANKDFMLDFTRRNTPENVTRLLRSIPSRKYIPGGGWDDKIMDLISEIGIK